ncbi:hypothetical protein BD311DRAFT_722757 [Dichomitus squalens]|nr:hypothetical protein BD311DRAFT_722757 [Dichomitus squalens]
MPREVNGASILFLLTRYITLATEILNVAPFPASFHGTVVMIMAAVVIRSLQYLPWAAFSALRVYALCPGPYRFLIAAIVLPLSLVPLLINMLVNLHWVHYLDDPQGGVIVVDMLSPSVNLKFIIASRASLVLADLLVLCVTWYQTYETVKVSRRDLADLAKPTFASTLLRDGTIYFLTLLMLNVLHMIFSLTSIGSNNVFDLASVIPYFEEPLTSILTSRFLVNLQQVKHRLAGSSRSLSQMSEPAFQPQASRNMNGFIGSLGAQLSFDEEESDI